MSAFLSLRDVWVEYGDKVVLERINLDIAEGAFVSVIGPSGAGKSSLLRLVLGQDAPTRGSITLDGVPLKPECDSNRGVVFQRYSVFPHLTVLDNTVFGLECERSRFIGRLFGASRRAAIAEAEEMLQAVGLGDSLHLYPAQMSGGMQQRLAIAQALIKRPRILLLDEPFGALDPGIRNDMHKLITRLWSDYSLTVMMVTHDIGEAFALGNRVLTLDKWRHDPHAPQRYGATVVYDLPLTRKGAPAADTAPAPHEEADREESLSITIDIIDNN
ncbi:ABC transporter ATP-binding protein [Alteraurantiacibacter aquimixticola]|uniref:ABC transporter ATP-binding protein n=1 Tax=Alteraurantiacibacter aquimixticola TaxID=2489173 RepID=A0A4T3F315_9SPHN|nr:ABC transporter ATP-binding protein [Alteraurantiacibacter aquimixticola]TIX49825.1 ABC transporter ATP-binding protein [Alteraurantiacibacter aquimixticola]